MKARHLWHVLGAGLLLWGFRGLLLDVPHAQVLHAARLLVIGVVGHDGFFAPACAALAVLTARAVPAVARTPVRVGLAFSVLLVLLALPSITSEHRLRNASVLPLDYERNLGLLLLAVAAGVALSVGLRLAWARWRRPEHPRAE